MTDLMKMYDFDLNDRAFQAIQNGTKRVEIRATKLDGSFDYSILKENDLIRFTNSKNKRIKCKIIKVNWYQTIEELLTVEGTKYTLSSTDDFNEGVKSINSLDGYSDAIKVNGVYAIHLEYLGVDKFTLEELRCENEDIDLDYYIEFRESVRARMDRPEWLGEIPKDGLEEMLSIGGKIWMYYLGDVPVCTWMFIPAGDDAKEDLEIEGIDYNLMGDIGPVFVNFDFLGHGLMYQMLVKFDEYLKSIGYKYVMTTVHPENVFSSNNMVKNGMKKVSQKVFKRGPRDIYFKELN